MYAIAGILYAKRGETRISIEFYSRTLKKHDINWDVRENEAWAIVALVVKFNKYIRRREFDVITDHKALVTFQKEDKKEKLTRWAVLLQKYKMNISYRKGNELIAIDFLSMNLTDMEDLTCSRLCGFRGIEPQFVDI